MVVFGRFCKAGQSIGTVEETDGRPNANLLQYPYIPENLSFHNPINDDSPYVSFVKNINARFPQTNFLISANIVDWFAECFDKLLFAHAPTEAEIAEERQAYEEGKPEEFRYWKINTMFSKDYREKEFIFLQICLAMLAQHDLPSIPIWIIDEIETLMTTNVEETIKLQLDLPVSAATLKKLEERRSSKYQSEHNIKEWESIVNAGPKPGQERGYIEFIQGLLDEERRKPKYDGPSDPNTKAEYLKTLKLQEAAKQSFHTFLEKRRAEIEKGIFTDMVEGVVENKIPELKDVKYPLAVYRPKLWKDSLTYLFDYLKGRYQKKVKKEGPEDVTGPGDQSGDTDNSAAAPIDTVAQYVEAFMARIRFTLFNNYNSEDEDSELSFEDLSLKIRDQISRAHSITAKAVPADDVLEKKINQKLYGTETPDDGAFNKSYQVLFTNEKYEYVASQDVEHVNTDIVILQNIWKLLKHRRSGVPVGDVTTAAFSDAALGATDETVRNVVKQQGCLQIVGENITIPFTFVKTIQEKPFLMQTWQTNNLEHLRRQQLNGAGIFIADGMGMGKTVSGIACALECCKNVVSLSGERTPRQGTENINILFVVKKSTIPQWILELDKFTGISMKSGMVCKWPDKTNNFSTWFEKNTSDGIKFHIVVMETVLSRMKRDGEMVFPNFVWDAIIVDEAQSLRRTTAPTESSPEKNSLLTFITLCQNTLENKRGVVVLMSGTPIINGAINLSAYANLVCPLSAIPRYDAAYQPYLTKMNSYQEMQMLGRNKGEGENMDLFRSSLFLWMIKNDRPPNVFPRLSVYPAPLKGANEGEKSRLDIDTLNLNRTDEYLHWQPSDLPSSIRESVSEYTYMKKLLEQLSIQVNAANKTYEKGEALSILLKMRLASIDPRLVSDYPIYKFKADKPILEVDDVEDSDEKPKGKGDTSAKEAQQIMTTTDILTRPSSTMKMIGKVVEELMNDDWKEPNMKPTLPHPVSENDSDTYDVLSPDVFYKKLDDNTLAVTTEVPADRTRKVLLFSLSKVPLYVISQYLHDHIKPRWPTIKKPDVFHGTISLKEREEILTSFKQDPDKRVLCLTIGAGSVGLNITEASAVVFVDRWWTQSDHDQAVARACRPGQTRDVRVAYVIPRNTVGRTIEDLVHREKQIQAKVLFEDLNSDEKDVEKGISKKVMKTLKAYYLGERNDGAGPSNAHPPGAAGPSGLPPPPPANVPPPPAAAPQIIDLTMDDNDDAAPPASAPAPAPAPAHDDDIIDVTPAPKSRRFENNRQATFNVEEELEKLKL